MTISYTLITAVAVAFTLLCLVAVHAFLTAEWDRN